MPNGSIQVKILVMERHFLYLPIYLAQYDSPALDKQPFYGKVPPQYSVEVIPPKGTSERSDAAVFDALMDARLGSSDIMFAICDPTVLLARPDKSALMVASLVSSSAFWAVNHNAQGVTLFSDLSSFKRVICYGERTTSNLIARRIVKRETNKLLVVEGTQEIEALEKLGEGTLAISPELLKIANLIHGPQRAGEKRAEIVLELCTTKEFSNVLTTALFTRMEVVEQHPELVVGVLAALQTALLDIHARLPIVAHCARHNYSDAYCVEQALEIAIRGSVFPATIQVRRDRWQRACEFYFISRAIADGEDKVSLTKEEELLSEQLYAKAVLDSNLKRLVAQAITIGFARTSRDDGVVAANTEGGMRRKFVARGLLLAAGFAAGLVFAGPAEPAAKSVLGFSWVLMLGAAWKMGEFIGYRKRSVAYGMHWSAFGLSWWGLHEVFVSRKLPGTRFIAVLPLDDAAASMVSGLGLAMLGAVATVVWSEKSKANKKAAGNNVRP